MIESDVPTIVPEARTIFADQFLVPDKCKKSNYGAFLKLPALPVVIDSIASHYQARPEVNLADSLSTSCDCRKRSVLGRIKIHVFILTCATTRLDNGGQAMILTTIRTSTRTIGLFLVELLGVSPISRRFAEHDKPGVVECRNDNRDSLGLGRLMLHGRRAAACYAPDNDHETAQAWHTNGFCRHDIFSA
jgi:hypothetical protein